MRQFVEEELRLSTGEFQGRLFRCDRNPFTGQWFDAIDSKQWSRHFATGPTGSGKTVIAHISPILYHLFEMRETVLCGVPSLDIVADKWNEDLLPAIEATRYKELLPRSGPGSRGGNVSRIQFLNGATLRFMTGGGNDKTRAAFHCRVLCVTETDGFDEVGTTSREATKLDQLEARISSRPDAVSYFECTVSTDDGRTWKEYKGGTQSRLAVRCQHCRAFVTPGREHLVGWKDAPDILAARELSRLACPECGAIWSEDDRAGAQRDMRLLHEGQSIDKNGAVAGDAPRTDTLGFRWTAANNLLIPIGQIAQKEWKAARDPDEENSEKKIRQFVWALPHESDTIDLTEINWRDVAKRSTSEPQGLVPSDATTLAVAVDLGKRISHWVALAIRADGSPHVVDYGVLLVHSDEMAEEAAIRAALRDFKDQYCNNGWVQNGKPRLPDMQMVDSGKWTQTVYDFCREAGPDWMPVKGFGEDQRRKYTDPRKRDERVLFVGDNYYIARVPARRTRLVHVDANQWKLQLQSRLRTPMDTAGAMTLFQAKPENHANFAKHCTAERQTQRWEPGEGEVIEFIQVHPQNHWGDATAMASVAADFARRRRRRPPNTPRSQRPDSPAAASKWSRGQATRWNG